MSTPTTDQTERPTRRRSVLASLLMVPMAAGAALGPVFAAAGRASPAEAEPSPRGDGDDAAPE